MAKILISGYYGFDNAGDDSVLFGIISSLQKHDPSIQLSVLSNKPEETTATFGIPAYNRWKLSEVIRRVREHDLLLMGGGSLLQDATSPRSVLYYLGIVYVAKLFGKPVVFYAQGVGPIQQSFSKRLIRFIVNKVDVITVRDHGSGKDLKEFGVQQVPIVVTADPAVTIPRETIDLKIGEQLLQEYGLDGSKTILFSVRAWKKETHYKQALAQVADHFAAQGYQILFLPMQFPADITPSQEIQTYMHYPSTLVERPLHFKEIMSLIGNTACVLGMRLHSIILAAVMNTPFVGISYDPKVERFVERLGLFSAGHIYTLEEQQVIQAVENVLESPEEVKKLLATNLQKIIQQAEQSSSLTLKQVHKVRKK